MTILYFYLRYNLDLSTVIMINLIIAFKDILNIEIKIGEVLTLDNRNVVLRVEIMENFDCKDEQVFLESDYMTSTMGMYNSSTNLTLFLPVR